VQNKKSAKNYTVRWCGR